MNFTKEQQVLTTVADLDKLYVMITDMKTELIALRTQHDEHFKKLIEVKPVAPTQTKPPKANGTSVVKEVVASFAPPKEETQGKLNARKMKPKKVEVAMEFFKKELADGPKSAKEFRVKAHMQHIFRDDLKAAEKALFVVSSYSINGEYCYALPDRPGPDVPTERYVYRQPAHDPLTYEDLQSGIFSSLCQAYLVGKEKEKMGSRFRNAWYTAIASQSLDMFRDGKSVRDIRDKQLNAVGDRIGCSGMVRRIIKAIYLLGTPQEKAWLFKPQRITYAGLNR